MPCYLTKLDNRLTRLDRGMNALDEAAKELTFFFFYKDHIKC